MKKIFSVFLALFALTFFEGRAVETPFYFYDQLEAETTLRNPFIIHMLFFPWDRQQKLLKDEFQFDHKPYLKMRERVRSQPNVRVVMWTYSKTKEFCLKYYPRIWKTLETYAVRPTMYCDILRWLVVYHFGGLYWQYDSIPLVSSMTSFLPQEKNLRLFVEKIITPEFAQQMAREPIRRGKPEELTRVVAGLFSSAAPKEKTIMNIIDFFLERLRTEKVRRDYDVLYITANAGLSEYYDLYGKYNDKIELTPLKKTKRMVNFNCKGRWRTDQTIRMEKK